MNLYRFRFLSQKCLQILSSPFWSQVGFRSQENNGSSRTVMAHFWDPLGLHVLEAEGAVDVETNQKSILKQKYRPVCMLGTVLKCSYSSRI